MAWSLRYCVVVWRVLPSPQAALCFGLPAKTTASGNGTLSDATLTSLQRSPSFMPFLEAEARAAAAR